MSIKYKKRNIEQIIETVSKQFPVIMLTGARQTGKSTTLKNMYENKIKYVSLDNIDERNLAANDPKAFLEKHSYPLIIDEFQYAPDILSYIKIIVDEKRFENLSDDNVKDTGLFYLTGSQRFLAMKNIKESLAGRVCILDMYGYSTREINRDDYRKINLNVDDLKNEKINSSRQTIKEIYERIFKGSYPELYNENIDRNKFYASYIETYIKRDIKELIDIKNEMKFYNFLIVMAAHTACELNIAEISEEIGVSQVTIKEWIGVLYDSGIIILLQPFTQNIIKRVVKHPKIHFMDTGLVSYLLKYPSADILENSNINGRIFETYVVSEIVKSLSASGKDARDLYYYRDNAKHELDLIYQDARTLYPIEIKKGKSIQKENAKNFKFFKNKELDVAKGIIICNGDDIFPLDNDVYCVPVRYI